MNKLNITNIAQTSLRVVNPDYKNETLIQNLNYFKQKNNSLFHLLNTHQCKEYKLALNQDNSFNIIHVKSGAASYPNSISEIESSNQSQIDQIKPFFTINPALLLTAQTKEWLDKNPLLKDLYQKLYEIGPLKKMGDEVRVEKFMSEFNSDFIPFLRIYGTGIGTHIVKILMQKDVSTIVIYEPNIDLFYCSLFVTPWYEIFPQLDLDENRHFKLMLGISATEAYYQEQEFIKNLHPFLTTFSYQLQHRPSIQTRELKELQKAGDKLAIPALTSGWYEDQVIGLINNIKNIQQLRHYYFGSEINQHSRVFIVGSGPSLNESIETIKQHQHDAIIFASGSGITPLLKNGIVPDFHILQERNWTPERLLGFASKQDYKNIISIKISALNPDLDLFYKKSLIIQKANDPGSCLLPSKTYPHLAFVNPTVTNTAIALAGYLNIKEIFLFGVDYGAPENAKRMHAINTVYDSRTHSEDVDKESLYRLEGNFSASTITTKKLHWSHDITQGCIAKFSKPKWFNVGDGAKIKGAKPLKMSQVAKKIKKPINKNKTLKQLEACFNQQYSLETVTHTLLNEQFKNCIDYTNLALEFMFLPVNNRLEINQLLIALYNAVNYGLNNHDYIPNKLLAGEFMRFIENVYIQINASSSEEDAITIFQKSAAILQQHFNSIFEDLDSNIQQCFNETSNNE